MSTKLFNTEVVSFSKITNTNGLQGYGLVVKRSKPLEVVDNFTGVTTLITTVTLPVAIQNVQFKYYIGKRVVLEIAPTAMFKDIDWAITSIKLAEGEVYNKPQTQAKSASKTAKAVKTSKTSIKASSSLQADLLALMPTTSTSSKEEAPVVTEAPASKPKRSSKRAAK